MALPGKRVHRHVERKLVVLDAAYSLRLIRQRQLNQVVLARDLDGFFDHVWSVHPVVGASPEHCPADAVGPIREYDISASHTVIEGTVGRHTWLERLPTLNFLLAQLSTFCYLHALIRREGVGVITAQDPFYLGLLALVLSRTTRVAFTVTIVANYDAISQTSGPISPRLLRWRFVERRLQRFVLSRAQSVAVGSADNLRYVLANGVDPDRVVDIGWGDVIEPVHFEDPATRASVRQELGLGYRPFLVFVGRLVPVKRPFDVLTVLAHAKRAVPELAAVFVGDGALRPALEARARELELADDVVFTGVRDQPWIARALADATAVVSPLTGRVLIEAALSGTPVVAYDAEWQAEFIADGLTGVIVPNGDTAAMAAATARLLKNEDEAALLGQRARAAALDLMDPARAVRDKRRQYECLLPSSSPARGRQPTDRALPR